MHHSVAVIMVEEKPRLNGRHVAKTGGGQVEKLQWSKCTCNMRKRGTKEEAGKTRAFGHKVLVSEIMDIAQPDALSLAGTVSDPCDRRRGYI